MTTPKRAFSQRNSGNVAASQVRSAERRQCPECGRKGALLRRNLAVDVVVACRYCTYTVLRDVY
jgi:ribosomal protein L37AE/L43A